MTTVAEKSKNDIVALVEATPVLVLTDNEKFSQFYQAMREECDAHVPNLDTEKGRKEIASLAYKVARTKTAIDDAGKKLNEEARARINAVDEARREIRKQLDDLKDEVRRPLTEWEGAEKKREKEIEDQLAKIRTLQRVDIEDNAASVRARIDDLQAMSIDPEVHRAGIGIAENAKSAAISALETALARLNREEEERAELERLRTEAAERERIEAEKRAKEDAARIQAEVEKAEQERVERLQREAEERAKAEAERKAREEREATERRHAEALAAERRRAEEAEAAAQAERDRIAREEAHRQAEADRAAAEQAKREADRAHRSKIMTAAKEAIMEAGEIDEQVAKNIVLAIVGGAVPNVIIKF